MALPSEQAVVSPNTIDEHLVWVISAVVGLIAAATLLTPYSWLLGLMAVDFFVLGFVSPRFSPLAITSSAALGTLHMTPKAVFFLPKQFAARVGFVVSGLAFGTWLLGLPLTFTVATLFLVVGAATDTIANYGLACWLYSLLQFLRAGIR